MAAFGLVSRTWTSNATALPRTLLPWSHRMCLHINGQVVESGQLDFIYRCMMHDEDACDIRAHAHHNRLETA